MREVEINEDGILKDVEIGVNLTCPVVGPIEQVAARCWHGCSWYHTKPKGSVLNDGKLTRMVDEYAFCKDHCIGRIKAPGA